MGRLFRLYLDSDKDESIRNNSIYKDTLDDLETEGRLDIDEYEGA